MKESGLHRSRRTAEASQQPEFVFSSFEADESLLFGTEAFGDLSPGWAECVVRRSLRVLLPISLLVGPVDSRPVVDCLDDLLSGVACHG